LLFFTLKMRICLLIILIYDYLRVGECWWQNLQIVIFVYFLSSMRKGESIYHSLISYGFCGSLIINLLIILILYHFYLWCSIMFTLKILLFFIFKTNPEKEIHHMDRHYQLVLKLVEKMWVYLIVYASDLYVIEVRRLLLKHDHLLID
jgi:hypothetical protein